MAAECNNIQSACDAWQKGAYSGTWPPPARIAVHSDGPTFLHRCEICGTYWHFTLRFANPIAEDKARELYPSAFDHVDPVMLS